MWLFLTGLLLAAVCGYLDCLIDWYQTKIKKPRPTSQATGRSNLDEVSPVVADHSDLDKIAPEVRGHNDLNKITPEVTGHNDLHEISPEVTGHTDLNNPTPEVTSHCDFDKTPSKVTNHSDLDEISPVAGHSDFGGQSSSEKAPTTNGGLRRRYESDLHQKRDNCQKNPGHSNFIPVNDFTIEHLPECHRNLHDLDFIMTVISLTVRLVVSYVSCGRPRPSRLPWRKTQNYYPLYQYRGQQIRTCSSGRVCKVYRKYSVTDGELCPCPQCEKLTNKNRKKQWGKFMVRAAKHAIFDDEECRHTQVDVDYNTDTDRDTCPKLHGVGVERSDMKSDSSYMICVSHDRDVCLMLEERCQRFDDLLQIRTKVGSQTESLPSKTKFPWCKIKGSSCEKKIYTVCISHPHGMSKHVSVGESKGFWKGFPDLWRYTTSACPGTSGAPVIRLGDIEGNVFPGLISCHSGYNRDLGFNEGHNELTSPYS